MSKEKFINKVRRVSKRYGYFELTIDSSFWRENDLEVGKEYVFCIEGEEVELSPRWKNKGSSMALYLPVEVVEKLGFEEDQYVSVCLVN